MTDQRPPLPTECFVWGRFAFQRGEPCEPPEYLSKFLAGNWIRGWENEHEQKQIIEGME